jgi:predicted porin
MKKIAKLSLVAAMAVTAANAASLEEAIKNVDVSGKVYVETIANTDQTTDGETSTLTDIDVDITFKSKVNDNVTAVVRVQADKEDAENGTTNIIDNADADEDNDKTDVVSTSSFGANEVTVDNVYFTYQNGPLTANIGKQDINTPNTDGEIGDGALALYNVGPVTLAAAHFISNEITNHDISAAAALGSIGPVNAELWYVNVSSHSENITGVVSGKLGPVSLGIRHATTDFEDSAKEDGASTKVTASASFGAIALRAAYFNTDEDNSAFVTDASSANTYELSQLGAKNAAGVDAFAIGASYTMDKMTYAIDYAEAEKENANAADSEYEELRLRATYAMSKNFAVMATYSMYEADDKVDNTKDVENNSARLEARYSF